MKETKNLSEQLFKPQFYYPETSSLVQKTSIENSISQQFISSKLIDDGIFSPHWYRVLDLLEWHWRGVSIIDVDEVLSRITAIDKKRSNPQWLDTIIGYQNGNWVYEFIKQAAKWQKVAEESSLDSQQRSASFNAWLKASQFASLASYPHYRDDDLATQAQTFAFRYYREAMNYSPYVIKEIEFTIDNKTVKTILHTPLTQDETPHPFPIVFLCAGLSNLEIDFYHYFANYLAPQGIGLLTIDSPSMGSSKQFYLSQNTSCVHQSILEQIKNVPLIDDSKVILLGLRFGANIATRLTYLMPNKVKGLINVRPIIHQLFVDGDLQQKLPVMYRDMLAQRLGVNKISNQKLLAELKFFSLKEQRIITRPCNTPIFNISFEDDFMSPESDAKLLTSTQKVSFAKVKKGSIKDDIRKAAAKETIEWMKALIK